MFSDHITCKEHDGLVCTSIHSEKTVRTTKETIVNSVLRHQLQHDRKKNDKENLSESYAEELDEKTGIASVIKEKETGLQFSIRHDLLFVPSSNNEFHRAAGGGAHRYQILLLKSQACRHT